MALSKGPRRHCEDSLVPQWAHTLWLRLRGRRSTLRRSISCSSSSLNRALVCVWVWVWSDRCCPGVGEGDGDDMGDEGHDGVAEL